MTSTVNLLSRLQQACEPGTACYLLIDPIMGDVIPGSDLLEAVDVEAVAAEREKAWGRSVYVVGLAQTIKLEPMNYPYLVPLAGPDDPWLEASLEMAQEEHQQSWKDGLAGTGQALHKIGGWLSTALYGDELATMLSGWMRLNTVARIPQKYLRLGDPRVLALLCSVLGTDVLQTRMGRLKAWHYVDAHGRLQSLDNAQAHLNDDKQDTSLPQLDNEQWAQMSTGNVVHGAIARAHGQRLVEPDVVFAEDDIPYKAAVSAALRFAGYPKKHGATTSQDPMNGKIRDQEDIAAAVTLYLLNPVWETHPEVRQMLNECGAEENLATRCMDIHEALRCTVESE